MVEFANHRVPPDADVKLSKTTHRGPTALDGICQIPREPRKVDAESTEVKLLEMPDEKRWAR